MKIGIVGGGVFGMATALEAAKRGHKVKVFERDTIPSPAAASNCISKATRLEYGPHTPVYAPLAERSFGLWREVEQKTNLSFFHNTGVLTLTSDFSPGKYEYESWKHLKDLGKETEILEPAEGKKRFPQFNWSKVDKGTFSESGGWIASALATQALALCAQDAGAFVHSGAEVTKVDDGHVELGHFDYDFDAVVVAAGAWVGQLVPQMRETARVSRQFLTYYRPEGAFDVPVWYHDQAEVGWYGFPMTPDGIVKVSLHNRAETVDPDEPREIQEEQLEQSRAFVKDMMPGLAVDSLSSGKCCFYTNSPTGDLVFEKITDKLFVAGLGSGHGFKFGPVLGELAMDCIEQGESQFRISEAAAIEAW